MLIQLPQKNKKETKKEIVVVRGEQKNQKTEKTGKTITEKTKPWKKPIKSIKIFKKQTGSVSVL